jgi:predicted nucleotidyltransferase
LGLFGSFVRNKQNEKSYLDIPVDFMQQIGIEFIDLADHPEKEF